MGTEKVNLDEILDYKEEYNKYLIGLKIVGEKGVSKCPFHNGGQEKAPSFSVNLNNGTYKCFACGETGNFLTFLSKIRGKETKDVFKEILSSKGLLQDRPYVLEYSLDIYSSEKHLPLSFLENYGLTNTSNGIEIPYLNTNGEQVATRVRYHPDTMPSRFKWLKGSEMIPYGLSGFLERDEIEYVILVEGESDCHTLWYNDFTTIGIPGANTFKKDWEQYFRKVKNIYIHYEGDKGADEFVKRTSALLGKKNIFTISCRDFGFKDPSEMWIKDKDNFTHNMEKIIDNRKVVIEKLEGEKVTFEGAPIQLNIPEDFEIDENGIRKFNEKIFAFETITKTPILLLNRIKCVDNGEEKIEVCFKRDKHWSKATVRRSDLFSSRNIMCLSDLGVNLSSEKAGKLVEFLSNLEMDNMYKIPLKKSTEQMGWNPNGDFIPFISEHDLTLEVDGSTRKWFDAYQEKGSFQIWKNLIGDARSNLIFRFLTSAAFAAPLLSILQQRTFVIHNWATSRSGKSAALKAVLSVWGNPEDLMTTFNATKVGLERIAGFFNDLPLGIDEKQVLGNQKQDFIESLVYMLSSGTSKIRGSKTGGLQAQKNWRSIVFTTGEEPIVQEGTNLGVASRTLEILGSPFSKYERKAMEMHQRLQVNYGFAGKEFIKHIKSLDWRRLSDEFAEFSNKLVDQYKDIASSIMGSIALVLFTDKIVSELFFNEERKNEEIINSIIKNVVRNSEQRDRQDIKYNLYNFITTNQNKFEPNSNEIWGMIEEESCYLFPNFFNKFCEVYKINPKRSLGVLIEDKVIVTDGKSDTTVKRIYKKCCRCYRINMTKGDDAYDEETQSLVDKVEEIFG